MASSLRGGLLARVCLPIILLQMVIQTSSSRRIVSGVVPAAAVVAPILPVAAPPCTPAVPTIITAASHWTSWLDRDNPSATGDWEQLVSFPDSQTCAGGEALTTDCRIRGSTATFRNQLVYQDNVLLVRCDKTGLACRNADQCSGGYCDDFEVNFYCEGVQFSSPVVSQAVGDTNVNLVCQVDVLEWIAIEILHTSSQTGRSDTIATIDRHDCPDVSSCYEPRVTVTTSNVDVQSVTNGRTLVNIHFTVLTSEDAGTFTCRAIKGYSERLQYEGQMTLNL